MTKRILVIEDTEDNRQILRDLLTAAGFDLIEAVDGESGVAMAKAHTPDLILMDIQLPVIDGYEATRRIKANADLKSIPIIVVTSYALSGDERRLTQVLLNLIGNAVKFTDKGEVAITAEAADGRFTVAVRDTGPGIAEADQARIFEEFQQVDNTNTRKKGGTGLGLAIAKKIMEMHGGKLTVQSAPGQGSTFRMILPVRAQQGKEAA